MRRHGTLLTGRKRNIMRRTDTLAALPLFSEVSRSELAEIRRHLTLLPVPAGRVLVQEGARGDQFMIIAEGEATVSQGGRAIATLERGDVVGEMALLDGGFGRRNATVTTATDALVYAGTPVEFRRILEAAPSVDRKVRQTAASRELSRAA
jgi:CRP-like cAMP-binding protein